MQPEGEVHSDVRDSNGLPLSESDELILAADDSGRFIDASREVLRVLGYSRPELLQMCIWDLTPGAMAIDGLILWQQFIRSGSQGGEYALRAKSGLLLTFEYEATANAKPGVHLSRLRMVTHPSGMRRRS